jgi:peptidyl-prolyl cis-trans isomerase C
MNEKEQGALRGNILKRLVTSRLLSLEAKNSNLENTPAFKKEVANFRNGLLYRYYMSSLKAKIKLPDEKLKSLKEQFKDNRDAFKAAKASYITEQYRGLYKLTIKSLRDKYHVVLHEKLISTDAKPETVILEGNDGGIKITMADVLPKNGKVEHKDQLLEKIYQLAELLVIAKAADDEGVDVSAQINSFKKERLPALYIETVQNKWTADEKVLKDYFLAHPKASVIPQRWHLGMIVLKTEADAKKVLERIHKGESLFKLAGELSIDPYGKEHRGDMGWVREYSGNPVIENAIKDLDDGKISGVIKTEKGYLIATILDRRPGGKRRFISMKDKVRQLVINEKMHTYLEELQSKHKVTWNLLGQKMQEKS